jgi:hypothetical protein
MKLFLFKKVVVGHDDVEHETECEIVEGDDIHQVMLACVKDDLDPSDEMGDDFALETKEADGILRGYVSDCDGAGTPARYCVKEVEFPVLQVLRDEVIKEVSGMNYAQLAGAAMLLGLHNQSFEEDEEDEEDDE